MFYADLGNSGPGNDARIERAFMDGSNRIDLKLSKILNPRGLTVDSINQRLFWVDSHLDHLETVDYHGLNRSVYCLRTKLEKIPPPPILGPAAQNFSSLSGL